MRKKIIIPRILRIEKIDGFKIYCTFNNGESRIIDFAEIFRKWKVKSTDIEYPLLKENEFKKVKLRNNTLSWNNIKVTLIDENNKENKHPYELSPDVLYNFSKPNPKQKFKYGILIRRARKKAGLTQEELAKRSGTTKFYISRIENNKTDIELSTFRKIIEIGLGRKLRLEIE